MITPTSLRKRPAESTFDTQSLLNRPEPCSPTISRRDTSRPSNSHHKAAFPFLATRPQQLGSQLVLPSPSFSGPSTGESHYFVNRHHLQQQAPLSGASIFISSAQISAAPPPQQPAPSALPITRSQYLLRSTANRFPWHPAKRSRVDPSLLTLSPSIQGTDFPSLKRLLRMLEKETNKIPVIQVNEKDVERNHRMRPELIEVILKITAAEDYEPETAFVAVNYLDRYLCAKRVTLQRQFYAVALACLFVASKVVEENREPSTESFSKLSPVLVQPDQIKKMEKTLLNVLDWNLEVVTPHALWHELHVFGTQLPDPSGEALNDYVNACLRKSKLLYQPASAYVTGLLSACGFDIKSLPYPDKWTRARV